MQLADSSVVVRAASTTPSASRQACRDALAGSRVAIAHVLAESYATLTRLPAPDRLSPANAQRFLAQAFPSPPLLPTPEGITRVIQLLAERGVAGGPIHDCLIAQVAVEHDATLVSRDRRAAQNYALIGAAFVLLD